MVFWYLCASFSNVFQKYIKIPLHIHRQAKHKNWKYVNIYVLCKEYKEDICNVLLDIHVPGVTALVVLMGKAGNLLSVDGVIIL